MTSDEHGSDDPAGDGHEPGEAAEAIRAGLRKATAHWIRAGMEVLAGVGALLDGIAAAGRDGGDEAEDAGPTRIQLD